jgi:poly(3-hydroxyalkanoate) synthetase
LVSFGVISMSFKRTISVLVVLANLVFPACTCLVCGLKPQENVRLYKAVTADGWEIAMHRHRPATPNDKPPVIVCHGFSSNRTSWDLDREHSVGVYLSERGYDVWIISLRGAGDSSKPGLFNKYTYSWNFDDYLFKDVPAVIEYVKKETGAPKVSWLGHSMGGMLMYAYLSAGNPENINTVVAVGSPLTFDKLVLWAEEAKANAHRARMVKMIPSGPLTEVVAPIYFPMRGGMLDVMIWNSENFTIPTQCRVAGHSEESFPGTLMGQFADWIVEGSFKSEDGRHDYLAGMKNIKTPFLFLAGFMDNLGMPQSVKGAYDLIGSEDKEYRIFGKANGCAVDYGHIDLIAGENAPGEVYEYIYRWLEKH